MYLISPNHLTCILSAFVIELLLANRKPSITCFFNAEYKFLKDLLIKPKQPEGASSFQRWFGPLFCIGNFLLILLLINHFDSGSTRMGMFVEIVLFTFAFDISRIFSRNRKSGEELSKSKEPGKLLQTTLSATSEDSMTGVIGPLFYAFIGGLPIVYLYLTLAVLATVNEETTDHPFGSLFYQLMNLIPTLLVQIVVPAAGFAAGGSAMEALARLKQKRQSEGIFDRSIPETAYAGALAMPTPASSGTPYSKEQTSSLVEKINRLTLEVAWVTVSIIIIITLAAG